MVGGMGVKCQRVAQRETLPVTVPQEDRGKNDSEVPGLGNHRSLGKKLCVWSRDLGI